MRNLRIFLYISIYLTVGTVGRILLFWNQKEQRRFGVLLTSWVSKKALKALDFKVFLKTNNARLDILGPLTSHQRELLRSLDSQSSGHFIISNHLSYLDVLVISSVLPCVFVTSREVEKTFFLGVMSKIGGSLFVERRNKASLKNDIRTLGDSLSCGFRVVVFPEGTSSNGEQVLPFKKSLLESAKTSARYVQPLCLNYGFKDRVPLDVKLRDCVFYYGDMTFGPHFLELMRVKHLTIEMSWLAPLEVGDLDRKTLSESAQRMINESFVPIK